MEKESIDKLTTLYASLPNDKVRKAYEQFAQSSANILNWINILIDVIPDGLHYREGLVDTTGKELKEMANRAKDWYIKNYKNFTDSFID